MSFKCIKCGTTITLDVNNKCNRCGQSYQTSPSKLFLFDLGYRVKGEMHQKAKPVVKPIPTPKPVEKPKPIPTPATQTVSPKPGASPVSAKPSAPVTSTRPVTPVKPTIPAKQTTATTPVTATKQTTSTSSGRTLTIAEEFDIEKYYFGKGDYKQMYAWAKALAEAGHKESAYYMGYMYEKGLFVKKNYTKAVYWYMKAKNLGDSLANEKIPRLLKLQTREDIANAPAEQNVTREIPAGWTERRTYTTSTPRKFWSTYSSTPTYKSQAERDYAGGKSAFARGDYKSMYEYMKRAADANYPDAIYYMGYIYEMGLYVAKNIPKAIEWYTKAADKNVQNARNKVNTLRYKQR